MNTLKINRVINTHDLTSVSNDVLVAGELVMDIDSNKIKIGDGRTAIKDLPWVYLGLDLATKQETSLSRTARMFIENNIDLIDNNDYDTLYSRIATPALAQEVTKALLKADLNPKPYLSNIPNSIRHILEPEDVWEEDATSLYTKRELDLKLDNIQTQLCGAFGIPSNLIKVGR